MDYSIIEIKLRRFIYLGQEKSIYVPSKHQKKFWKYKIDQYEMIGIKMIGKIVEKNKANHINSIIPIMSKIEKENNLQNYEYFMYLLAVCAKFNLKQCQQMIADAHALVPTICTDGLKLLMFFKSCNKVATLLYEQGYLHYQSSGYGSGTRNVIEKWYLNNDPLETTKSIMKHTCYDGITHKNIMKTIHLRSDDIRHQMYITFIVYGMKAMDKLFKQKVTSVDNESLEKRLPIKELRRIYNFIKQVKYIIMADKTKLKNALHLVGNEFEVVPQNMLKDSNVLLSFVKYLPLRTLLENTYSFARHNLFINLTGHRGCSEYINRFNDHVALKKSGIHPIESYLEYLRYSRSGSLINGMKYKYDKKQILLATNELEEGCFYNLELILKQQENLQLKPNHICQENKLYFMKPVPAHVNPMKSFLATDLVEKTLNNLESSGRRLFIAYDNGKYMSAPCKYMHLRFVKVCDAIILIILSLIYPEQSKLIKPTICALFSSGIYNFINVDYEQLTFQSLKKSLFQKFPKESKSLISIPKLKPLATINWAIKNQKIYDVFVFLGTSTMDLQLVKTTKADYEKFSQSKIKIIVCCLNGNHTEQRNLSGDGMLFISGFDKNVGKIIDSFINDRF